MSKRDGTDKLAGTLASLILLLPIMAIVYLIKGIIYLITFISEKKAKKEEEQVYNNILDIELDEQLMKIDDLDGFQFEKYIGQLLKKIGFVNVIVTKGSGDFGADIIAEKDNIRYAFQCKRFNSPIGPKPIGEVLRGMKKYNCEKGIVITNNFFTNQAIQESKICDIELWDRNKLSYLIQNIKSDIIKKD